MISLLHFRRWLGNDGPCTQLLGAVPLLSPSFRRVLHGSSGPDPLVPPSFDDAGIDALPRGHKFKGFVI